ncbi:MAG: hypothetical protein HYY84_19230 [Deltaproteobacteria bacterium]|nr:hypothetical protein [Deltaproteobacteria bacterium]
MTRFRAACLSVAMLLGISAPASAQLSALDRQRAKAELFAKERAQTAVNRGAALMKGNTEPTSGTDITDERLEVVMTPSTGDFRVTATVSIAARSPISTSSFILSDVTVTSVQTPGGAGVSYAHSNGVLILSYGRTLSTGETFTFVVAAQGPLSCSGQSDYCVVQSRLSHLLGVYFYPISYDGPWADRFNIDLTVDVPDALLVNAPGNRAGVTTANGRARHRFVSFEPTPFVTLSIGQMVTKEATAHVATKDVPVRIATMTGYESTHDKFLNHTVAAIELFSNLFLDYPYGKLDVAMTNSAFSGGMAPQATFYIGEVLFQSGDAGWTELILEVFSHETAHQWFGNHVAPATNDSNWLSEGFAEYLAVLHSNARTATWAHLHAAQEDYRGVVGPSTDGPIDGPGPGDYFRVVYEKGAAVLHMLRRYVGETAFFTGVRNYLAQQSGERVPIKTFEDVMETTAGFDLTPFFNVWLRETGYPKFVLASKMISTAGGLVARITVSEPSGRAFPMRVPLEVFHEGGAAKVDVFVDKASQSFDLPVPSPVLAVRLDEAHEALRLVQPGVPADVNASGRVDGGDLLDLAARYGEQRGGAAFDEMSDVDGNGDVDEFDVNAIKANWGLSSGQ